MKISNRLYRSVLLIVPLNAIADVTTNYFPATGLNSGNIRAGILVIMTIWLFSFQRLLNKYTLPILLFLLYIVTTLIHTTDAINWLSNFVKLALGITPFILGFFYLNRLKYLKGMTLSTLLSMMIILVNFIVANLIGVGESLYVEESVFMGGAGANITPQLALMVLTLPVSLNLGSKRYVRILHIVVSILAVLIIFLILRRSAILAILIGFLVYGIYSGKKKTFFILIAISTFSLLSINILFGDLFSQRLEARTSKDHQLQNEARFNETFTLFNYYQSAPWHEMVFGVDMFNSIKHFGGKRGLHVDYNIIWFGSGILGLLLYLNIYFKMYMRFRKLHWFLRAKRIPRELASVFMALLISSLIISFSKGLLSIGLRSFLFLYLGGLIGYLLRLSISSSKVEVDNHLTQ